MDSLNLSSLREILNYSYTSICRMAYISAAKEWNGTVERKLDDDYRCQDDDEFNRRKDEWRDKKECRYWWKSISLTCFLKSAFLSIFCRAITLPSFQEDGNDSNWFRIFLKMTDSMSITNRSARNDKILREDILIANWQQQQHSKWNDDISHLKPNFCYNRQTFQMFIWNSRSTILNGWRRLISLV